MIIRLKKLTETAKLPTRAYDHAAGWDLYADCDTTVLRPCERAPISTGLAIEIPVGYYARIAPRSGLAVKFGIDILAGIIDSDYRGDIKIVMVNINPCTNHITFNSSSENRKDDFIVKRGDKIAQLIIAKCEDVEWVETEELTDTARGEKGFGSSNIKAS